MNRQVLRYASTIPGFLGTGGMSSKIKAGQKVSLRGVPAIIACGFRRGILQRIFAGEQEGTLFMPRELPSDRNLAVGRRLKLARIACGMGKQQGKFAKLAGISPNTYNQWETGVAYPGLEYAIKLCDRHNLSLDWIYRGKMDGLPTRLSDAIRELQVSEAAPTAPATEAQPPMKVVQPRRRKIA